MLRKSIVRLSIAGIDSYTNLASLGLFELRAIAEEVAEVNRELAASKSKRGRR